MFLSNQIEVLADLLGEELFASISKRKVIVPDSKMRNFLQQRIALHSSRGVAMGMELHTLADFAEETLPSKAALALHLEHRIASLERGGIFLPLHRYLESSKMPLHSFSDQLARVFLRYALYGGKELSLWKQQEGWQQALWGELDFSLRLEAGFEWHLFGFNALPPFYLEAFKQVKSVFYLLSPSACFWEDFCTDKQKAQLSVDLKASEQEALEEYLQDQHPLLANMGKLGRSFLQQLHDFDPAEYYTPSQGSTTLSGVQNSMLSLSSFEAQEEETSLQIHPVASRLEEVELIFSSLQQLILEEGFAPEEIQVVARDINAYAPYIHMIFGREESSIPYAIADLAVSSHSFLAQGVLQIFQVVEERFSIHSLFKLLDNPAFLKKHPFSEAEQQRLSEWVEETGTVWGVDRLQREAFLQKETLERSDVGTWKGGFERLFYGFAMLSPLYPFVDMTETELLERWVDCIYGLRATLAPVLEKTTRSATEWLEWMKEMIGVYFAITPEDESFLQGLDRLKASVCELENPIFSFASIQRVVENFLQMPTRGYHTADLSSVLFSSFSKGSPVPKKIIWILGLGEEEFPRRESPLPLLQFFTAAPSQADVDRYLFLEYLLSARKMLIASYVNVSSRDHKEVAPSRVLQELYLFIGRDLPKKAHPTPVHALKNAPSPPLLPSFFQITTIDLVEDPKVQSISLKKLESCARHPLKFFFQEKLKLYLEPSKQKVEEFSLGNFTKAALRKEMFKREQQSVLEEAFAQGKTPVGRFKETVQLHMEEEMDKAVSLLPQEVFSYDLTAAPLSVVFENQAQVEIRGKIGDVSLDGLLFYGDDSVRALLRIWPTYLVFLLRQPEEGKKDLLLLKQGKRLAPPKEDPKVLLKKYLSYYNLCLQYPCPLLPDWGKPLLEGNAQDFQKVVHEKGVFKDEYLEWIKTREGSLSPEVMFANWASVLSPLFSSFLEWRDQ